jgi:hypothetical protein
MTDKVRDFLTRHGFVEVVADVKLEYGGLFYRHGSQTAIKINDLDNASPSVNGWLVEEYQVGVVDEQPHLGRALFYCGHDQEYLDELDEQSQLLCKVDALVNYDHLTITASAVAKGEKGVDLKFWSRNHHVVDGYGYAAMLRAVRYVM